MRLFRESEKPVIVLFADGIRFQKEALSLPTAISWSLLKDLVVWNCTVENSSQISQ